MDLMNGFTLGDFEVVPRRNLVISNDRSVHLEPMIMDVCCLLASRSGEVISRDELIDDVWKAKFGSDESLTRAIYVLRKTFDQSNSANITIETIPKRGYRLVLPVGVIDNASVTDSNHENLRPGGLDTEHAKANKLPKNELRHVVALSCQLDRLSDATVQRDPELWHSVAVTYRRAVLAVVHKFGGHLASEFGSDLVVCFGYPRAQEDAAERAIRAGQAIINSVSALTVDDPKLLGVHLTASIGIHSGLVMVATDTNGGIELFGEAPGLAAQVREKAAPGTLLVTTAIHDLVPNLIVTEASAGSIADEDDHELPLVCVAKTAFANRSKWSRREPLPFVGRAADTALLLDRVQKMVDGAGGSFILVGGEAGVGKSRLLAEVKNRTVDLEILCLEAASSSLHTNTPFHAIIQLIESVIGWQSVDDLASRQLLLEQSLRRAQLDLHEAFPLVADLLRIALPDGYAASSYPAEVKRKRLIATLAEWIFNVSSDLPVAMHIEDLHWTDPSSLELIQLLVEQCSAFPLILIATTRPEFRAPWARRAHHADLVLSNMDVSDTRSLISSVLPADNVTTEVLDAIIQRSGGIPLFAEELAYLVLDQGRSIGAREIPVTLFDSLSARLDKLRGAKEVAQLGAVLGREFPYGLLQAVSSMAEADLQAALIQIADAGLLQERGLAPNANYTFKHALIHDAAYEALPPSRRRELHAQVAKTMVEQFPLLVEAQPQILASHWTEAGELELAIPLWIQAGKTAVARHAFQEAADNFRAGLRLLARLPETPERDTRELEIGFELRRVLYTLGGYRRGEVKAISTRNAEISEKSGDIRLLVELTFSSFVQSFMASNWLDARESAAELTALSKKFATDQSAVTKRLGSRLASYSNFLCLYYQGIIKEAEPHFVIWSKLPEVGDGLEKNRIAPCFSHAAASAALAGRLDLAMERQAMAVAHSLESGDLWDRAFIAQFGGLMHIFLRDPEKTMLAADQALNATRASGFRQLEALTLSCAGWAKTQTGYPEKGLALIQEGLSKLGTLNNRVSMGVFILFRAEAEAACGQITAARASFDEALNCNPEEQLYVPLILIGRARFEMQTGNEDQAVRSFQTAIDVSSKSGAKTLELRARVGLAELLTSRGVGAKALEALAQCVRDFGEQPLSIDLQEAKALIQKQAGDSLAGNRNNRAGVA